MTGIRGQSLCKANNTPPIFTDAYPSFSTVDEARDSLQYLWYCFLYSRGVPQREADSIAYSGIEHETETYQSLYWKWSAAFEAFLGRQNQELSPEEQESVSVLQIQGLVAHTSFNVKRSSSNEQLPWDEFCPTFQKIVDLSALLFERPTASTSGTHSSSALPPLRRKASTSLDFGVIGALYDTAVRCRHPVIRKKAVAMLRASGRQEGIWDSALAARIAGKIVEIEEEGLGEIRDCSDVPASSRIAGVVPSFEIHDRRAMLTFYDRRNESSILKERAKEMIEW